MISLAHQKIKEANSLLKEKIPSYQEPTISYVKETKATSYWANIGKTSDGKWGIHISSLFGRVPPNKLEKRMLECMIHELIHTIPGCDNHKRKFKFICSLFYPELEVYSCKEKIIEDFPPKPKYLLKCPVCNYAYYYCRRPKYPISYYMCKCGNKKLKLEVISNEIY